MLPRRVVTGVRGGRSAVLSDGAPPNGHDYKGLPGFMNSIVWATAPVPTVPPAPGAEPAPPGFSALPAVGETRLMVVRFPPDSAYADPRVDFVRLGQEQAAHMPGFAEKFEPDNPGMHTTDSLDYAIVLDGEIWLELDDGQTVHLKQGDIVVQGGVRHAWRNPSDQAATMAFVLIGAVRNG